jgi:hypothetical protein
MHISTPCHAAWEHMTPREHGRHCAACDQTVVDLTALTPTERRARLATIAQQTRRGQRVCVRSVVERDGALAGSRRVLTGGMAVLLAMTLAGCQGDGPQVGEQAAAPVTETQAVDATTRAIPAPVQQITASQMDDLSGRDEPDMTSVMGEVAMTRPTESASKLSVPDIDPPVPQGAFEFPAVHPHMPHATN